MRVLEQAVRVLEQAVRREKVLLVGASTGTDSGEDAGADSCTGAGGSVVATAVATLPNKIRGKELETGNFQVPLTRTRQNPVPVRHRSCFQNPLAAQGHWNS